MAWAVWKLLSELSRGFEIDYDNLTARRGDVRNIAISAECADSIREPLTYRLRIIQEKISRNLGERTLGS